LQIGTYSHETIIKKQIKTFSLEPSAFAVTSGQYSFDKLSMGAK
jgi:hypothetical protein